MDVPVNLSEQRGLPLDLGMEYEILLLQIGSLARKKDAAKETLQEHQLQLDEIHAHLEKKNKALLRLQKESFSNTVMKMIGTYDHAVDRESEEVLRIKLEFDKAYSLKLVAQRRLNEIDEELDEKKVRLRGVKEVLLRRNPTLENMVSEQEQAFINLQHEYQQTLEAEEACFQLLDTISDILLTLDGSKAITSWELITEIDVLLNFVDRDQLDMAEAMILDLERNVQTLERELSDLNYIYANQYESISAARPAIDAFFTNLFSEWSTKDIIEKSLQHLKELQENVIEMMDLLSQRKRELEKEYARSQELVE